MVSGYCVECRFPAVHKCPDCGVKLCNNCQPGHVCDETEFTLESPAIVQKVPGPADNPAPAKRKYTKRGRF